MLDGYTQEQLRAILEARSLETTFKSRALTTLELSSLNQSLRTLQVLPNLGPFSASAGPPTVPLANVSSVDIFGELRFRQKALYGDDDRVEIIDSTDPLRRERSRSVAAVVERSNLVATAEGLVSIGGYTLEQRYALAGKPLCHREAFRSQPCAAIGTAFLIAPTIVATAHHCLNANTFEERCLLFDFETAADGIAPTQFRADQIYGFRSYLAGAYSIDGADWSLIELDRPAVERSPLPLASGSGTVDLLPLYVVGHPSGLPKKIAGNAQIRINTAATHFVANLDTYGGNSGSPVFNALTHEVVGILARGATDFVSLGDCYASLICPITGCRGEDCVRIDLVVDHLSNNFH